MDPFASHVLRALFVLICPELTDSLPSSEAEQSLRSKKSAKYKAKQGPMKSVFESRNNRDDSTGEKRVVPKELSEMTGRFVKIVRDALSENEVRALAANKVACPVLAVSDVIFHHHPSSV
jgi:nucleolar protein 9